MRAKDLLEPKPITVLKRPPEPVIIEEGEKSLEDIYTLIERKIAKGMPIGMIYTTIRTELTPEAQRHRSLIRGASARDSYGVMWSKQKEREDIITTIKKNPNIKEVLIELKSNPKFLKRKELSD